MEQYPWVSIFYTAFLHLKQLFWAQQHTSKLSFKLYILTRPYPKLVGFDTLSLWVETRKQNWSEEFTTWVTESKKENGGDSGCLLHERPLWNSICHRNTSGLQNVWVASADLDVCVDLR